MPQIPSQVPLLCMPSVTASSRHPIPLLTTVKSCLQSAPLRPPPLFTWQPEISLENANLTTLFNHFKLFNDYKAHLPFEKAAVIWPLPTCLASSLSTVPFNTPNSGSTCQPSDIFIHGRPLPAVPVPSLCPVNSHSSFKAQLKCFLLWEAFPTPRPEHFP